VTAFGDKNVRRLDVAMDDALGMRGVQSVGNLDGERNQSLIVERPSGDAVFQGLASRNSIAM
jgi:hypothetical protein